MAGAASCAVCLCGMAGQQDSGRQLGAACLQALFVSSRSSSSKGYLSKLIAFLILLADLLPAVLVVWRPGFVSARSTQSSLTSSHWLRVRHGIREAYATPTPRFALHMVSGGAGRVSVQLLHGELHMLCLLLHDASAACPLCALSSTAAIEPKISFSLEF